MEKMVKDSINLDASCSIINRVLRLENVEDTGVGGITADIVGRNIIKFDRSNYDDTLELKPFENAIEKDLYQVVYHAKIKNYEKVLSSLRDQRRKTVFKNMIPYIIPKL